MRKNMNNQVDESKKKWHWYLIFITWQVRDGRSKTSGTTEISVSFDNRNISEKLLTQIKEDQLEKLLNNYGEDESMHYAIQIQSLSYLGHMSRSEYYDDEN